MKLKGKTVLVLGLARTGSECASFFVSEGARVSVSDRRNEQELAPEVMRLAGLPIRYLMGGEEREWLTGVDLVVPSPGVAQENGLLKEAAQRRIPVLSEIELAYRFLRAPLVAKIGRAHV